MKAIKIMFVFCLMSCQQLVAQQEAQFTQYMDNMLYYNPAYAGSRDMMNFALMHRQQWAGYKGAPMSTTFGFHTPLRYESIGVGLSMLNDKAGPLNATWINADLSYSIRFKNNKARLAFGVKAGLNVLNGDLASLVKQNYQDDDLNQRYSSQLKPNIGAGIYYHSKHWFVGLAVPRIIDNSKDVTTVSDIQYIAQRHYYLTVGGYIQANRMLKLRPSAMLKVTENAPLALDLSWSFIFYDKLWIGANYRLKESAAINAQFQISHQFKVGYAFEFSTTQIRRANAGTHEVLLSYDLLFKNKTISSPRYF